MTCHCVCGVRILSLNRCAVSCHVVVTCHSVDQLGHSTRMLDRYYEVSYSDQFIMNLFRHPRTI